MTHGIMGDLLKNGQIILQTEKCPLFFRDINETMTSLLALMNLFRMVSSEIAQNLNYNYPNEADQYTSAWVASECANLLLLP